MFENGVLKKVFGNKRVEVISGLHMKSVVLHTFHLTLLDNKVKKGEVCGACEKYGREGKSV